MMRGMFAAVTAAMLLLLVACSAPEPQLPKYLQQQIALGEKVFQEKDCGACHTTDASFANGENRAPDLGSVFLAMDTLFVKAHLQFSELSAMPPIAMTPAELSALVQYIGHLHAKAHTDPNVTHDGICPVCGALLNRAQAEANHLVVTYDKRDYFFECPDCKIVFERDPAWHSKSGYLLLTTKGQWPEYR